MNLAIRGRIWVRYDLSPAGKLVCGRCTSRKRTEPWGKHIPHDERCCMNSQVLTQFWCVNWLTVVSCRELFCTDTESAGCSDTDTIPEATKWIRDAKTYRWLNANETSLPLWEWCLFRIKPSIYVTLINYSQLITMHMVELCFVLSWLLFPFSRFFIFVYSYGCFNDPTLMKRSGNGKVSWILNTTNLNKATTTCIILERTRIKQISPAQVSVMLFLFLILVRTISELPRG